MMDKAWDVQDKPVTGTMTSIFQGKVLRELKGPDGRHFRGDGTEGRYVFSLGADFFNPLTNKIAGKKISCGCLVLSCLNLPIELRYKPENMFLIAVVPGPQEPSLDNINPYMAPIVDVFLKYWDPGVYYLQTLRYPLGRLMRLALVALISDLLAARKFAGFASCTHNFFCAACLCTRKQHGYGHLDPTSWIKRSKESCRTAAEEFRIASSAKAMEAAFEKNGMRWSEFSRLPYFDLSKYVVVDSMHNLLLGLLKEHFTGVLGYTVYLDAQLDVLAVDIPVSESHPAPTGKPSADVTRLLNSLRHPCYSGDIEWMDNRQSTWAAMSRSALMYVAKGLCEYEEAQGKKATRKELADHIMAWRSAQVHRERYPETPGSLLTAAQLIALQNDVLYTVTPSWVPSVPKNLGEHGSKLRADEWRIIGSLYLPLTLTRLWSIHEPGDQRASFRLRVLQLTSHLVSAVNIAMSRETSEEHATRYYDHMLAYLKQVHEVLPTYKFHPNHHQAVHIAEYIRFYGPVHGWWTFPFERVIGQLQRISTNYKPGEYERTIGVTWQERQTLKTLFSHHNAPPILKNCLNFFRQLTNPDMRGTLSADARDTIVTNNQASLIKKGEVAEKLRSTFLKYGIGLPEKLIHQPAFHRDGARFTPSSKHQGNSNVFVTDAQGSQWPASIQYIVRDINHDEYWFLLRRLKPLEGLRADPFQRFPELRMKLWSQDLYDELDLAVPNTLQSHYARRDLEWQGLKVAIVVDLSRTFDISIMGVGEGVDDETMDVISSMGAGGGVDDDAMDVD
ncbi:hypothetical protein ONZ45_g7942 [Pleurotus djamor]|nr:hypothetical protein ONZ45_g7942 [Pleurotus djamor]